jgi:uncharacterized protein YkwD
MSWSILRVLCSGGRPAQPRPIQRNDFASLEAEVVDEVNLARTQPRKYAFFLVGLKGTRAVNEAISFLRSAEPLSPLRLSKGMSQGAKDHVENQGPEGTVGHIGRDGSLSWERINRYGTWHVSSGENIVYGSHTARDIVRSVIVDEGVVGRRHRKNIFNPEFRVIGVACGHHSTYQTMCVMDFAGEYVER